MSSDIIVSPVLSPGTSLDAYVRAVSAIPVISADREKELASQFVSEENLDSARQLVLANSVSCLCGEIVFWLRPFSVGLDSGREPGVNESNKTI